MKRRFFFLILLTISILGISVLANDSNGPHKHVQAIGSCTECPCDSMQDYTLPHYSDAIHNDIISEIFSKYNKEVTSDDATNDLKEIFIDAFVVRFSEIEFKNIDLDIFLNKYKDHLVEQKITTEPLYTSIYDYSKNQVTLSNKDVLDIFSKSALDGFIVFTLGEDNQIQRAIITFCPICGILVSAELSDFFSIALMIVTGRYKIEVYAILLDSFGHYLGTHFVSSSEVWAPYCNQCYTYAEWAGNYNWRCPVCLN